MKKKKTLFNSFKRWISSLIWLDASAGGICTRTRKGKTEILLITHKSGKLMIPKGSLKSGESIEHAALREFSEETGLKESILGEKVGVIRDRTRRKKITLYQITLSNNKHSFHRDEAFSWVEISQAVKLIRHSSEEKFLKKYFQEYLLGISSYE